MQIALTSILDVDRACQHIRGLNLKFPWVLTVERRVKRRSLPQNSFYWGVIIKLIATETGDDEQSTHETLKDMYCPTKPKTVFGVSRELRSTTLLNESEMTEYCERCMAFAASELGISFPTKDEVLANDNAPSNVIPFRRAA